MADHNPASAFPLEGYRILDLSDEKGFLCGSTLADFGADVIKMEKPGGDNSRNHGPFYRDIPDSEKSLYWFVYNANKRGITLNLETGDGRDIFKCLVRRAHFIVETHTPGYMDSFGLGFNQLSELNRSLIMVSITHFGQTGPWRDYTGSDIVHMGQSGFMYLNGDRDRAPLRISIDQAYLQAALQAAAAAMIAHYYRLETGEGQQIDVSVQEAAVCASQRASYVWEACGFNLDRWGNKIHRSHLRPTAVWACKDGYVSWRLWVSSQGTVTKDLVNWMNSEGFGLELADVDWQGTDLDKIDQAQLNIWESSIARFFLAHTKRELHEGSIRHNLLLFPVNEMSDILQNPQLEARGAFVNVPHGDLGATLTYPNVAVKTNTFRCGIRRRAPSIGEHNDDIYQGELGLTTKEVLVLKERGVI